MHTWIRVICALALLIPAAHVLSQQPPAVVDFRTEIQPILTKNCQGCPQGGAPPADLRLDSAAALLQGSISGKVVVPGKSAESLLVQRIIDRSGVRMPLNG